MDLKQYFHPQDFVCVTKTFYKFKTITILNNIDIV